MSRNRLTNLAIIAIENNVCETLNIFKTITEFRTVKARKNKM